MAFRKPVKRCIDSAYALLARREHSRHELFLKLKGRDVCDETDLDALLDALEQENLLSDERFAEMSVRSGISRGYGPIKIRFKLREKGIDIALVQKYLENADINWFEHISDVRRKRFGDEVPAEYNERARQSRFLASRGFDSELIRTELDL